MLRKQYIALFGGIVLLGTIVFFILLNAQRAPRVTQMPPPLPIAEPLSVPREELMGALIDTRMESRVGVLLDEIPTSDRERLAQELLQKPEAYWYVRAIKQIRFTTLRRNYGTTYGKKPLPLPPEELWQVKVTSPARRERVDNHDLIIADYRYQGTLLSDALSPAESEAALGTIGGTWTDQLMLPLDPEFVFQRTRFACMNESESPPNSIDAEEADSYYDQKCHVEAKLANIGCHQTEMPTESCEQAVVAHIGAARPKMVFERLPWSKTLADSVRVGTITNPDGPDLQPIQGRFTEHRIVYRYIPKDSCTIVEKCVGGSGWRQLLTFPTGDLNSGSKSLDIGRVDYFHNEGGSLLADHGVYEYSACHEHYHFSQYGSFSLGEDENVITRKQGFCLQPTSRLMNHELSPLNHPYTNCLDQGVAVGWLDEYNMGLECQWLDVTKVKVGTHALSFTTNPEGMLCEGTRKFDEKGRQLFEKTSMKTMDGKPVDRPVCEVFPDWAKNNTVSYEVKIPASGESYITEPCTSGIFGPLRNCGLQREKKVASCEPGAKVALTCTTPKSGPAQVLRLCEASRALKVGIPCTFTESLATKIIKATGEVSFSCPSARDSVESGGQYTLFNGALFPEQATTTITCVTVGQLSVQKRTESTTHGRIDVDDPIITNLVSQAMQTAVQTSLLALETDLTNWRQTPGLNEQSLYQRRCTPRTINASEALFQCTVQTWLDEKTPSAPVTSMHGLNLKTGEWLTTEEANERSKAIEASS